MRSGFFIQATGCVALLLPSAGASSAEIGGLSNAEITRIGKAATAFIEAEMAGTAFCVHPAGLFVTNNHLLSADRDKQINLVLDSGLETERVVKARWVRSDKQLDLALLRVEGSDDFRALTLGSVDELREMMELVVFGFPKGRPLAIQKGRGPAISVNVGSVSSLRRKGGELFRIQIDGALQQGHSGAPVLDRRGTLAGVVVSGKGSEKWNLMHEAIPVSHVRQFLSKPEIQFTAPTLNSANVFKPVEFRARSISVVPPVDPVTCELLLRTETGKERRHKMQTAGSTYRVTALAATLPTGPLVLAVEVKYADGLVRGTVADQAFDVGDKTVKFSEVRSLRFGRKPQAILHVGAALTGNMPGLEAVPVRVGGRSIDLNLTNAVEVNLDSPIDVRLVSCTVVASQRGEEIARINDTIHVDRVVLQEPTATYSHEIEPVSAVIGGLATSGWGVYPNLTSQTAVFETRADVGFPRGTLLTFVLDHQVTQDEKGSYPKHVIGKFRLSLTTDGRSAFADGLPSGGDVSASWIQLTPMSAVSDNGTILTIGSDNTILASGVTPSAETYTVAAVTELTGITGFRLEVLNDASLPSNGPGRNEDGNFCLTGFAVSATPSSILPTK